MLKDLVEIQQLPLVPEDWDCEKSIEKIKPLIIQWKNLTLDIAYELLCAREKLSKEGNPHRSLTGSNDPVKTWNEYCESIGITKATANRWLAFVYGPVRLPSPILPKIESQVLYADPPWAFDNSGFDQSAAQEYPVLKPEIIENYTDDTGRQIRQLAKQKGSILFLWVPAAIVPEGLQILKGWGFEYKAQMVWKKDRAPGIGWWVKSKHELLFIGALGSQLHPAIKFDSVFESPVTTHSKKPELVYEMIEAMYTGPYIELFARNTRPGWESWGNEIPS